MPIITPNRRTVLAGLAAAGSVGLARPGFAATGFKVGGASVTALSDGHFDMPAEFWVGATEDDQAALGNPVRIGANAYVHHSGDRVFLFDAGAGNGDFITTQFPTVGEVPAELAEAGFALEDVTDVVITHMHPDHVGGVVYDGVPTFPNATIHIATAEWDFWTRDGFASDAPEGMRPMVVSVQGTAAKIADQVALHDGEADLGGGVMMEPAAGHTPGHVTILLTVGSERLLVLGDTVVSDWIHFAHPDVGWVLDLDPDMARATRKRVLERAAKEGMLVAGNHISASGLGHVEPDGDAFRFVPL